MAAHVSHPGPHSGTGSVVFIWKGPQHRQCCFPANRRLVRSWRLSKLASGFKIHVPNLVITIYSKKSQQVKNVNLLIQSFVFLLNPQYMQFRVKCHICSTLLSIDTKVCISCIIQPCQLLQQRPLASTKASAPGHLPSPSSTCWDLVFNHRTGQF